VAQSARIERRIEKAAALNCKTAVSETSSIPEDSQGDLQKAGFGVITKEAYERGQER
jgi:hypothetical protein